MDRFLDWLDANIALMLLKHAWPWALVTASLAVTSVIGIFAVARRYHDAANPAPWIDSH